jgi:ricin-type beta-trefoil lectin protein
MNAVHRTAAAALLALAASWASAQTAIRLDQIKYITEQNADTFLKPGDIMMKRLNDSSPATTVGIAISQTMISNLYGTLGSGEADAGDPSVVHAAIYLGGGLTAEAHGHTDVDNEGVSLRHLSQHAGFVWYVYRPLDASLGVEAAAIARTWATGRMGYLAPFSVPFHDSDFGAKGRSEALEYGRAAYVAGGPPGISKMFCSQFVLAVYQAADVQRQLKKNPKLNADQVTMYIGMDRQASNTSPLVMHGHLSMLKIGVGWDRMGFVVAQLPPKLIVVPPLPQAGGAALYKIAASGRCITAFPTFIGKTAKGSPVILGDCTGAPFQKWRGKNGLMVTDDSPVCLSVVDGRLVAGQRLVMWDCHGGPDQQWAIRDDQFEVAKSGLCADGGPSGFKGFNLVLGKCAKNKGNTWARGS